MFHITTKNRGNPSTLDWIKESSQFPHEIALRSAQRQTYSYFKLRMIFTFPQKR